MALLMRTQLHIGLSFAIFAAVWIGLSTSSSRDMRQDVDLGIATSKLSFWENAIWCLPLALTIWIGCEAILLLVHWWTKKA